jgi:intein/homing endonuclease
MLGIPYLLTNHTYKSMDLYPKDIMKGGCLAPGVCIQTETGLKLIEDIKKGDYVLTLDGYEEVLETHIYNKELIEIELEDGTTYKCSPDHKFLINEDYMNENSWIKASDISENDTIYKV